MSSCVGGLAMPDLVSEQVVTISGAFTGEHIATLHLESASTVKHVKLRLQPILGVDIFCQRLLLRATGEILHDDITLASFPSPLDLRLTKHEPDFRSELLGFLNTYGWGANRCFHLPYLGQDYQGTVRWPKGRMREWIDAVPEVEVVLSEGFETVQLTMARGWLGSARPLRGGGGQGARG